MRRHEDDNHGDAGDALIEPTGDHDPVRASIRQPSPEIEPEIEPTGDYDVVRAGSQGDARTPGAGRSDGQDRAAPPEPASPARRPRSQTGEPLAAWTPPRELGEYQLQRPLGRGGMGRVYLYWNTELERSAAIKFVGEPDEDLMDRLREEAKAAAGLKHGNVVTIYRVGEFHGFPFIVSEYIAGTSLNKLTPIRPFRRLLDVAIDLARGLAAAHKAGVIHGDIKPANAVLERESGDVKLIDFGLAQRTARPVSAGAAGLSPPGRQRGRHESGRRAGRSSSDNAMATPSYAAPELWNEGVATERSDVYAFGVMLYELYIGRLPPADWRAPDGGEETRWSDRRSRRWPDDIDPGVARIILRCVAREPAERYASGEALRAALEELERPAQVTQGNPYRWLRPFEAEHRSMFFGRDNDIWHTLDLLRSRHFTVLAGGSGVGKSSLLRAGVLPALDTDDLGEARDWTALVRAPGPRPLRTLGQALARRVGDDPSAMIDRIRAGDFKAIRRQLRERHGSTQGTVLVLDQLEELVTQADPAEARYVGEALASLIVEQTPGVRVMATARLDLVHRLAHLPGLGPLVSDALQLISPLSRSAIRDTIVGPAQAQGVEFESGELVDELVAAAAQSDGGLPLLQFALAQLWQERDTERQRITRAALERMGGVAGALARQADGVVEALAPETAAAARRILLELVTAGGTRARRSRAELEGKPVDAIRHDALEALIKGRLVAITTVDHEPVCEIAHEALQRAWPTLERWLDEAAGTRALRADLSRAVREWEDLERAPEALWGSRKLAEALALDPTNPDHMGAREADFLDQSRRAVARARRTKRLIYGAPPVIAAVVAAVVLGVVWYAQKHALDDQIAPRMASAQARFDAARADHHTFRAARSAALQALLDDDDDETGETAWAEALTLERSVETAYREATRTLEQTLALDPTRGALRQLLAEILDAQARFAEDRYRGGERDELVDRLGIYDRQRQERWLAPVPLRIASRPPGAAVTIERYITAADGAFERQAIALESPITPLESDLEPGSYLIILGGDDDHIEVRFPMRVTADLAPERRQVTIPRPRRSEAPFGFIHVPAGRFLFGYGSGNADEFARAWYGTVPLHERETEAYWIAENETTIGQWIAFHDACTRTRCPGVPGDLLAPQAGDRYRDFRIELIPPGDDRPGSPGTPAPPAGTPGPDASWRFSLQFDAEHRHQVTSGQPLIYTERDRWRSFEWRDLPVTGVSPAEVGGYLAWLDTARGITGARLCREDEWERAARGADSRMFAHGDRLRPDDANFDLTHGKRDRRFGPDAVGSHPPSDSPFGLHDTVANVWELTASLLDRADDGGPAMVVRGGSFFHDTKTAAAVNRMTFSRDQREVMVGFRVCIEARNPARSP